jgi:hypothetical protein
MHVRSLGLLLMGFAAIPACDSFLASDGDDPIGAEERTAWINSVTISADSVDADDAIGIALRGLSGPNTCYRYAGVDSTSEDQTWTIWPVAEFQPSGDCTPTPVFFEDEITMPTLGTGWNIIRVTSKNPTVVDSVFVREAPEEG